MFTTKYIFIHDGFSTTISGVFGRVASLNIISRIFRIPLIFVGFGGRNWQPVSIWTPTTKIATILIVGWIGHSLCHDSKRLYAESIIGPRLSGISPNSTSEVVWSFRSFPCLFGDEVWQFDGCGYSPPPKKRNYTPEKLTSLTGKSPLFNRIPTSTHSWWIFQPVMLVFGEVFNRIWSQVMIFKFRILRNKNGSASKRLWLFFRICSAPERSLILKPKTCVILYLLFSCSVSTPLY